MTLDFPRNLKHLPGYEECKNFVYQYLVKNTTCKVKWEEHLSVACRKWPGAAEYLQNLSLSKERWAAPWRLDHFTLGMEASSVVEGSFSAFHRHLGGEPRSFVGVVQQHIQKDKDKIGQEKKLLAKSKVRLYDSSLKQMRTHAVNECAKICSHQIAEKFADINKEAQDYAFDELSELSQDQQARGVENAYSVYLKGKDKSQQPQRIVEKIGGIYFCRWCKKDINSGQPCKHIQRVCDFDFNESQFHDHWKIRDIQINHIAALSHQHGSEGNCSQEGDQDGKDGETATLDFDSSMSDNAKHDFDSYTNNNTQHEVGGDGVGEFVSDFVDKPLQVQQHRAHKKPKKMTPTQMYNSIMDKSKQLANTASSDTDIFNKLSAVMDHLIANVQNDGEEELVGASASYLDVERTDTGVGILPSVKKRSHEAMSTKRRKSAVEVFGTKSRCDLCKQCGHNKAKCAAASEYGKRLTKSTWEIIHTVETLIETKQCDDIDPDVAKEAIGLQILGKLDIDGEIIYKANVIITGLRRKECEPQYLTSRTVTSWANSGGSSSHYVFLYGK